nr:non-ribosomal peptide synthetase [Nocardia sp. CNY236]
MRRSVDLVVGMYAVHAAGGAYVPLDLDHPADRTQYVLDTAAPVCVLTSGTDLEVTGPRQVRIDRLDLSQLSDAPLSDADRHKPLRSANTAYVIFTSGSTGRPKGVAVSHAAIVNRLVWMHAAYGLAADDVVLQKTPATFDVSVWEFFWPLQVGARLVLAHPDGHRDPAYLAQVIAQERVTTVHFVPSMLSAFITQERAAECSGLRNVFASGEALPAATAQQLRAVTGARLHNLYGPTEAAVDVTFHEVTDEDTVSVPIGAPVFNTEVYVLDTRLQPVPVGVAGELYLAGTQLAHGYVGRPDLTTERFVANPFGDAGRMYRTGDLVAWTSRGELEYLGRTDFQVKVRGLRIELGEIESALTAVESIAQAVVVLRSDQHLGDQLVAYLIAAPHHTVDIEAVRADLTHRLPGYMAPAAFVVLDQFPLNPSGKLDRRALPEPVFETKTFRAPVEPVQEIVAGAFAEALGADRVGLDDDFFALGGNSLIATQVVARLGAALDTTLVVRDLFEASTVVGLADRVARGVGSGRGRPGLVARPRPDRVPLSPAQQRYWFLNQFDSATSAVDNIPLAVRLTGALDVAALHAAITDVIARHEILHTVYPRSVDGPHQVIVPASPSGVALTVVDVSEADVLDAVIGFAATTFDVTVQVPLAVALFRIAVDEYVLAFTVHHVAADGASMGPLARDVMIAYAARVRGEAPQWQPLAVQYADYALWQREVLGAEDDPESVAARQVAYWSTVLAGLPDQLELPTDRPRPARQSFRGSAIRFHIDPRRHARLQELARAQHASLFMVVHAALAVLLARLSGTEDIAVGTPIAGRGERELDDLIGMFVNTLVLRTRIDAGESFTDLLARQRETDLQAFAHADVPFEQLVEVLNPVRSTARNPLFQVGLSFQNLAETSFELPGLSVSAVDFDSQLAKTDLHITLYDRYTPDGAPAEIIAEFGYATDLFDASTVQGFVDRFERVLDAVVADPAVVVGDIDLLTVEETRRVVHTWNGAGSDLDVAASESVTLASLMDAAVVGGAGDVAVVVDEVSGRFEVTYAQLDARVNRLARYLIGRGVGPEDRVVLAMRRSLDLVVAMYAVVKAGGVYVPVDPEQPAERVGYILASSGAVCVLSTRREDFHPVSADGAVIDVVWLDEVEVSGFADTPVTDGERVAPVRAANTAYVIFTSGSTGRPKGVAITHGAIVNQLLWKRAEFGMDAADAVLVKTTATFDLSVWEYWSALACGGRMVLATPQGHRDLQYVMELITREWVTTLHLVPSMLEALTTLGLPESVWRILAIGEALPARLAQRVRHNRPRTELFNLYGPTEAAVSITHHRVSDTDRLVVPIGVSVAGSHTLVLDARLHPVPVGVVGELYLAGVQLARGYHGRADLTTERFVADPFGAPSERMYRTGDLVRWSAGGELEYVGRVDFQVKIRGFRIELGEIETVLAAQPGVTAAVVVAHHDSHTGDRLVAYVVVADPDRFDTHTLRTAVSGRLPSYMVPTLVIALPELPVTVNGKLDRKALPEPVFETHTYRPPSTPIEEIIAAVFTDVLGVTRVGVDDHFFTLGGDSILSIQLVSQARLRGVIFTPRDVFERSTVAALAEIATLVGEDGNIPLVELAGRGVGEIPLTANMHRFLASGHSRQRLAKTMVLRLPEAVDRGSLVATIGTVLDHHDVLRSRLGRIGPDWRWETLERGSVDADALIQRIQLTAELGDAALAEVGAKALEAAQSRLDPPNAVMVQFVWFAFGETPSSEAVHAAAGGMDATRGIDQRHDMLLIVAHHFVVDSVSWGILISDLAVAWSQVAAGQPVTLPVNGTSMRRWSHSLVDAAHMPERVAELPFWQEVLATPDPLLGVRPFDPQLDTVASVDRIEVTVPTEVTEAVLDTLPTLYHGDVNDGLLSALAMAVLRWRGDGSDTILVELEGHGREENVVPGADLSRTVGWFSTSYPVRLDLTDADLIDAYTGGAALGEIVQSIKEQLRAVPDTGLGYGLLRQLNTETAQLLGNGEDSFDAVQIGFKYLGRVSAEGVLGQRAEIGWAPVDDLGRLDADLDLDMPANATIDIDAIVTDTADGPQLGASFAFPRGLLGTQQVQEFADGWVEALTALAEHVRRPGVGGFTPSDMPLVRVRQHDLELWERTYPGLVEVWPLSPLQSGLLFHALMTQSTTDVYTMQAVVDLSGALDVARLRTAVQGIIDRYQNLRTAFVSDVEGRAVQVALDRVELPWREVDLTELAVEQRIVELRKQVAADRATRFDMSVPPLLRFTLLRSADAQWHLAITIHHILLDGWSMPLLMRDLLVLYAVRGDQSALPRVPSYRTFLSWLAGRDRDASLRAWADALDGVTEPTQLAAQPRSAETYEVGKLVTEIDADHTRRITKHAAELGITVNTLVQAAWGILLGRLTGRGDVIFGATVSGRPADLPDVESMVGLFINTLPVRLRIDDGQTIGRLLQRLQREQAELLDHHYVGLTDIQRAWHAQAGISGSAPMFDTLVVFESYPMDKDAIAAASSIDGMSVTGVGVDDATHYPLTLLVVAESTIQLTLKYLDSRFTADEVQTLAQRLVRVLEALHGDPDVAVGEIDILDAAERDRLLADSAGAAASVSEPVGRVGARTVASVLSEMVEEDPAAPAVLEGDEEVAYQVLDRRSSQLARVLIEIGAGPGDIVAVALPHTVESIVAVWAVQKAGAACLLGEGLAADELSVAGAGFGIALEPLADSEIRWVELGDQRTQAELASAPAHPVSYADRVRPLSAQHPAFVVVTEGEVVVLSQSEALAQAERVREQYEIDYESTTFTTAASGRVALLEFLAAATAGALSVLPTGDLTADLSEGEVTHWFVAPGDSTAASADEVQIVIVE